MLVATGDGTYLAGPLDVICVLRNVGVQPPTYHIAFLEEHPFPGLVPPVGEAPLVRLGCKMSRTEGRATLEEARADMPELTNVIQVPEKNLWEEVLDWDGELAPIWLVPNWTRE
jgi:hypothetical protein